MNTLETENKALKKEVQKPDFFSKQFDIIINKEKHRVLAKDVQFHPVKETILHVDFLRIGKDTKVTVAIPVKFINENLSIKLALRDFNKKNLGVLIAKNKKGNATGIISDGDFKRINYKSENIKSLIIKKVMKKNPIIVNENMLAAEALSLMNSKKITALCVYKKNKKKIVGLIHMHNILKANMY